MRNAAETAESVKESWWRRWLLNPVVAQLTGGTSPTRIAWTISLGVVLGVFPIMGSTTLLCLVVGWMFRLNQPILHAFKSIVYPLHLALILVFIRLGERIYGVPLISLSIPELVEKFKTDPLQFFSDFGMAAWHGVSAWLLIAPVAALLLKMAAMPLLQRLATSLSKMKEVRA